MLVIGIYRSDDVPRGHPLRRLRRDLRSAGRLRELVLEPARRRRDGRARRPRCSAATLSPSLAAALHERTEGVPFFVEELAARARREREAARRRARRRARRGGARAAPRHRARRRAVARGEPLGRSARTARGRCRSPVSRSRCRCSSSSEATAGSTRRWRPASSSRRSPGLASFRHALTREALYRDVPWARRRELHRRYADQLTRRGASSALIAEHWLAAHDDRALGRPRRRRRGARGGSRLPRRAARRQARTRAVARGGGRERPSRAAARDRPLRAVVGRARRRHRGLARSGRRPAPRGRSPGPRRGEPPAGDGLQRPGRTAARAGCEAGIGRGLRARGAARQRRRWSCSHVPPTSTRPAASGRRSPPSPRRQPTRSRPSAAICWCAPSRSKARSRAKLGRLDDGLASARAALALALADDQPERGDRRLPASRERARERRRPRRGRGRLSHRLRLLRGAGRAGREPGLPDLHRLHPVPDRQVGRVRGARPGDLRVPRRAVRRAPGHEAAPRVHRGACAGTRGAHAACWTSPRATASATSASAGSSGNCSRHAWVDDLERR